MLTLARWSSDHRRAVVALWFVAAHRRDGPLERRRQPLLSNDFSLPGTDAQRAADLLSSRFPAQSGDSDQIVLHTPRGTLAAPAVRGQVEQMLTPGRAPAARHLGDEPVRGREPRDLQGRDDRLRDGRVRPAREPPPRVGDEAA